MKVLFLRLGHQPGFDEALFRMEREGKLEKVVSYDFLKHGREQGWPSLYEKILRLADELEPDVVFFQFFHYKPAEDPSPCIQALRGRNCCPLIVVSNGDPYSGDWMGPHYPRMFRRASALADLNFVTQMGESAEKMVRWGARNIVLLPHANCEARFPYSGKSFLCKDPEFDVVFIGSFLRSRNFLSHYKYAARKRKDMVDVLARRYGKRFGLFGYGWDDYACWQGPSPFDDQLENMRRGQVVFGGYPHSRQDYYMSDRPFFAVASGVPFVDLRVPRVEKILRDGEHWFLVDGKKDLVESCDKLLSEDSGTRAERASSAREYIYKKHTVYHRMEFIRNVCLGLRAARKARRVSVPEVDCFLPEVDRSVEAYFAVRNWQG